jgi:L-serine dehydratase
MLAAGRFASDLRDKGKILSTRRVIVQLYGSLAFTGVGHGTDRAILLGLCGHSPVDLDPDRAPELIEAAKIHRKVDLMQFHAISFDPERDIQFCFETLQEHPNGMRFEAYDGENCLIYETTLFSIGGGFIATAAELSTPTRARFAVPYPFSSASELLQICRAQNRSIAELVLANERAMHPGESIEAGLRRLRLAMRACLERGLRSSGELPGGLKVRRRASGLHEKLKQRRGDNQRLPHEVMDWVSLFAIAVNEENAAGGRVVTAPTNGAAGVIPAVLEYYDRFCPNADEEGGFAFLLTAAAIGGLFKQNASISGAEVGCQGEVGVACSMASAGLCAALGGTPEQIENAAEIGMEHHLGMTCDPVAGLVQVPCIERNAMGAVKAINAASLALNADGRHLVSLDAVINTMRQTGRDMLEKYKETSQGGLAVNVIAC